MAPTWAAMSTERSITSDPPTSPIVIAIAIAIATTPNAANVLAMLNLLVFGHG